MARGMGIWLLAGLQVCKLTDFITAGIAKQLTSECVLTVQPMYTPPMLIQCWASVAAFGLTLKQHWFNVLFE